MSLPARGERVLRSIAKSQMGFSLECRVGRSRSCSLYRPRYNGSRVHQGGKSLCARRAMAPHCGLLTMSLVQWPSRRCWRSHCVEASRALKGASTGSVADRIVFKVFCGRRGNGRFVHEAVQECSGRFAGFWMQGHFDVHSNTDSIEQPLKGVNSGSCSGRKLGSCVGVIGA